MARKKLTDKGIKALMPAVKIVDFYDEGFTGGGSLILTVSPGGTKTFYVAYRAGKQKRKMKLGTYPSLSLIKARKRAREIVSLAQLGKDPWLQKKRLDSADTFDQLADLYLKKHARVKKKASSAKQDEQRLNKYLRPEWGNRKIHEIKKRDVLDLLDYLVHEKNTPVLANRIRALVSKIFSFAVQRDLLEMSPSYGLPAPVPEKSKERFLSDDEIRILWKVLDQEGPLMAGIFRLLLLTGQRQGEVKAMEWRQIQGDLWNIPAELTKNGLKHHVPLSQSAMKILEGLESVRTDSKYVFPSRGKSGYITWFSKATARIRNACGFDFTPHDLRHTARTKWAEMGIPNELGARIQNHVSEIGRMARTYDHYDRLPEMRQAMERWASRLEQIVTGKPSKVVKIR